MQLETLIFDINETLLDMDHIKSEIANILGSESLVPLWFSTLLHHSLVENSTNQFHGFGEIGAAALVMVGHANGITLTIEQAKSKIISAITDLPPHPDVPDALEQLKRKGFKLIALSNSAQTGLRDQLSNAQIDHLFDHILSVETVKKYKPDPSVYQWAVKETHSNLQTTMMVAAHGWDTSGAKLAGLRAAFVERTGKMEYPLGAQADLTVKTLAELVERIS